MPKSNMPFRWSGALLLALLVTSSVSAQRYLNDIPDPDPESERQQLQVAEGFEIQLYAAEPMLAKPIQINFDEQGRLWVASSEVYPQIKPGQVANDKVLVLEDTDGDGQADKSTVFADGLLIPTGVLPGDGGCYVANSTELIHLRDTDGDGRADQRRVMLSGFGTEDTHHILHTLRWGYDGMMYMCQSIYIHSHIETPHGVRRMNGAGIWAFRPETRELDTFSLGLVNPWGFAYGRFGQTFATDGAGGEGINYVFPGFVGVTSPGARRIVHGLNPGKPKLCGLEIVGGSHLPLEWQSNLITNDFRANRVCRYVVTEDGSGYAARELDELVKTRHVGFRPVDVKQGPDGAIYIADWYNPIIQHGEVDFRDPRRDHVHGRIWRVSYKGRRLADPVDYANATIEELLDLLISIEPFQRHHAKLVLKSRGAAEVIPELDRWIASLGRRDWRYEEYLMHALWTCQALDHVHPELLRRVITAESHRVRAAGVRVLYHWNERVADGLQLLEARVVDEHPRVRLEAVRALSRFRTPQACEIALRALDLPTDRFLDFCLWQTVRDLQPIWYPAFQQGELDFAGHVPHLTFALQSIETPDVAQVLLEILDRNSLPPQRQDELLTTVATTGTEAELKQVFDQIVQPDLPATRQAKLLAALLQATRQRQLVPAGDLSALSALIEEPNPAIAANALRAAGLWRVHTLEPRLIDLALHSDTPDSLRQAAIEGLGQLGTAPAVEALKTLGAREAPRWQIPVAVALFQTDPPTATAFAARLLSQLPAEADPTPILQATLARKDGAAALAEQLADKQIQPDVAKLALRAIGSTGRNEPELTAALTQAANLQAAGLQLSAAERQQLLDEALQQGDPMHGEIIYRNQQLACQKCHAIGGAGGQVGPDLASIGASAPPDYLLESLLEPGKKIKENYHSVIVETDRGQILTGIKVRETDNELILRNAEDQELRVPLDSIEEVHDGGSLMPAGLVDSLTRTELRDLLRFLSELGKVGQFSLSKQPLVRQWHVLPDNEANADFLRMAGRSFDRAAPEDLQWNVLYSRVSGELPLDELPIFHLPGDHQVSVVRFTLEVPAATQTALKLNQADALAIWMDQQPLPVATQIPVTLPAGQHAITIVIDRRKRHDHLQVEMVDGDAVSLSASPGR